MNFTDRLELVQKILDKSQYLPQKETITSLFEKTDSNKISDIILRLVVIDSGYSTQMNKRLFAFEDIAEVLLKLRDATSPDIDAVSFFESNEKSLVRATGIDKKGQDKGHAFSLISKYLYFATNYNFPIYDSLVFDGLKCEGIIKGAQRPSIDYFKCIKEIVKVECTTYDFLDQYFWTIGKIKKGSLSLLLPSSEIYISDLIKGLELTESDLKKSSTDFDAIIAKKLVTEDFTSSPLVEISTLAKDIVKNDTIFNKSVLTRS